MFLTMNDASQIGGIQATIVPNLFLIDQLERSDDRGEICGSDGPMDQTANPSPGKPLESVDGPNQEEKLVVNKTVYSYWTM